MKKTFIIALTLLAGLFAGCNDDSSDASVIAIDSTQLEAIKAAFPADGDSRTATIKTNLNSVKVTSTQPWCKGQILDEDGFILRISTMPNEGFENRSAMVVVYGKGIEDIVIPITQFSGAPFLTADKSEISVVDGDLRFSLTVTSNVDYVLRRNGWIDDDGDNAVVVGTKTYNYKVGSINPETSREGRIDIKVTDMPNESLSRSITVTQTQSKLNPVISTFTPTTGIREAVITLKGENFGTNASLIKAYFNTASADIVSVTDTEIKVSVPKVTGSTDAVETTVKIVVDEVDYIYVDKFTYNKSWYLSTVTGNGATAFKGGTLADGQVRARYLCVDDNDNIFVSHRESNADLHLVKINEAANSVVSLGGPYTSAEFINNAPIVLPDGKVLVANDQGNATLGYSYYIYDPANNWQPERVSFTYDVNPAGIWVYRYSYNPNNNCLYGFTSGDMHIIDMATKKAVRYATFAGKNIWPYAHVFNSAHEKIYTATGVIATNGGANQYGPWVFDPGAFITSSTIATRMNSSYTAEGYAPATAIVDGPLVNTGSGAVWGMDWGPDGRLYLADCINHVIRAIDLTANPVTIETILGVAGSGGTVNGNGQNGRLNGPRGIAWNKAGTALYISDFDGCTLRKWAFE